MITLEEAEALNRAVAGQRTVIAVWNARDKFAEVRHRMRELTASENPMRLTCENGGVCYIVQLDRLPDSIRGLEFQFSAIADDASPSDRALILARVKPSSA